MAAIKKWFHDVFIECPEEREWRAKQAQASKVPPTPSKPLTRVEVYRQMRQWRLGFDRADRLGMHDVICNQYAAHYNYYLNLWKEMEICGATTTDEIK